MSRTTCPDCKSHQLVEIIYGPPGPDLSQRAERGEIALADSPDWTDGPDRKCLDCGQRFFSDSAKKRAYDADTAHQVARLAAMKRGDYMFLDPRTSSAEELANAVIGRYGQAAAATEPQSKEPPKRKR